MISKKELTVFDISRNRTSGKHTYYRRSHSHHWGWIDVFLIFQTSSDSNDDQAI